MKTRWIAALLLAGLATTAVAAPAASTDRNGALAAAKTALAMISSHDGDGLAAMLLPGAIVLSQRYDAEGELSSSKIMAATEIAESINDKAHILSERMFEPVLQVVGDLAHVWTPYTFELDGKRTHCGIDSLALAKVDGKWRIASFAWTVEPGGCAKWKK